jgi:hypothetical protein
MNFLDHFSRGLGRPASPSPRPEAVGPLGQRVRFIASHRSLGSRVVRVRASWMVLPAQGIDLIRSLLVPSAQSLGSRCVSLIQI